MVGLSDNAGIAQSIFAVSETPRIDTFELPQAGQNVRVLVTVESSLCALLNTQIQMSVLHKERQTIQTNYPQRVTIYYLQVPLLDVCVFLPFCRFVVFLHLVYSPGERKK